MLRQGLTADEVDAAAKRLGDHHQPPGQRARPASLPYPRGRHPRGSATSDGAIRRQRESGVQALFAPLGRRQGLAVADVPEAVRHGTPARRPGAALPVAHTHVPTIWDEQGQTLTPLEWTHKPDGSLGLIRVLPNKVMLTSRVMPGSDGTRMEFRVTNDSAETISRLPIQFCIND